MPTQRWNGTSWVDGLLRRWTGSAWALVSRARRWNGTAWVEFYPAVKLTNTDKTVTDTFETFSSSTCTAGLGFRSTGEMEAFATSLSGSWFVITPNDEWMIPRNADSSNYEIRATTAPAGVSSTNTAGTTVGVTAWSSLSAGRRFSVTANRATVGGAVVDSGTFTIEIRDAVSLSVIASCTARLTATAIVSP